MIQLPAHHVLRPHQRYPEACEPDPRQVVPEHALEPLRASIKSAIQGAPDAATHTEWVMTAKEIAALPRGTRPTEVYRTIAAWINQGRHYRARPIGPMGADVRTGVRISWATAMR